MSQRAILLPYCTYQNEPSVPFKEIYNISDDKDTREEMLTQLFKERVYGGDEEMVIRIVYRTTDKQFGDMWVTTEDADVFLFVTLLD